MDPLPYVNRAFYLVQQVEKQKEVGSFNQIINIQEVSALVAQRSQGKGGFKKDWKQDKIR